MNRRIGARRRRLGIKHIIYDDAYSPMNAENTQLQETEWTEDIQTY